MGLTADFVGGHIEAWEKRLLGPYYPYREKWPSRLFHHAPIENAVSILKAGRLLSRNDSQEARSRDVAAAGVIDNSHRAHRFARLYFRPRTPTQFHIEGIRRPEECRFGEASHAPVLVMLVFDARRVLTTPGTHFSSENMQSGTHEHDTEEFFSTIPFEKVYHEGGTGGDNTIIRHRCAEVLAPSPLVLDGTLQWIYCRSTAEKETLVHQLGRDAEGWENRIVVSDDLRVFEKKYTFVESVSLSREGIAFRLNPRPDLADISMSLSARHLESGNITRFSTNAIAATPPNSKYWRVSEDIKTGSYFVEIRLDGHLAYQNTLVFGDAPF